MAKKAYLTIDGTHRNVKKRFLTDNNVYHKVKKAFITIGGVHRPFMASGLEYFGEVASLSNAVQWLSATYTENHAIFAGGDKGGTAGSGTNRYSAVIEAYDNDAQKTVLSSQFTTSRAYVGTTSVEGVAMFAGGSRGRGYELNDVFGVDDDFVLLKSSSNLNTNQDSLVGASYGDTAVFGGGISASGTSLKTAHCYSSELVFIARWSGISAARCAAASLDDVAMFAGGMPSSYTDSVDVVRDTVASYGVAKLSVARGFLAGTRIHDCVLFAGGNTSNGRSAVVDAYDAELTRISGVANLSVARSAFPAVTVEDCALFLGGEIKSGITSAVDAYDAELTRTIPQSLTEGRACHAATKTGNMVYIGGGKRDSAEYSASVEAYIYG